MHPADGVILAVIAISTLFGVFRGFVREAISLAGWFAAYIVALVFHARLESYLAGYLAEPSLRMAAAWVGLFVATLLLAAIIGYMIHRLIDATGISGVDRMLGAVFGLLRGLIIVLALLVTLAPLTSRDAWWQDAALPGVFMRYEPLGRTLENTVIKATEEARHAVSNHAVSHDKADSNASGRDARKNAAHHDAASSGDKSSGKKAASNKGNR